MASQFLCSRFSEYRILRCRGPALSEGKSQWSEQSALPQCELFEGGRYEWVGAVPRSGSVCVGGCGWVDEEGQVYPHRQGRPWPAAEPHTLTAGVDLNCAPCGSPPLHTHTHIRRLHTPPCTFLHKNHKHLRRKRRIYVWRRHEREKRKQRHFFRIYFTCVVNRKIGWRQNFWREI